MSEPERGHSCPQQVSNVLARQLVQEVEWMLQLAADRNVRAPTRWLDPSPHISVQNADALNAASVSKPNFAPASSVLPCSRRRQEADKTSPSPPAPSSTFRSYRKPPHPVAPCPPG